MQVAMPRGLDRASASLATAPTVPAAPLEPAPAAPASPLPVQADQWKGSVEPYHWVRGADPATYRKVGAGLGAASVAFASHLAMLGGGGYLGARIGSSLLGLPGAAVGAMLGVYGAFKLQNKTLIGRHVGGRVGAAVGSVAGSLAGMAGIPLRSDHIQETKDFSYARMVSKLGTTNYTSHPHLSEAQGDAFLAQLQPGDVVLTNDEASTPFSLLVAAVDGKGDFNHAILYVGDGKTIESRTLTHGVAYGDLKSVLGHKHHAVAVRPRYQPGQAAAVIQAGEKKIGLPYDYKFRLGNDAMYCSEVVYEALKEGAPQLEFRKWPVLNREVVLPGDLLKTAQAEVVAEAGVDRTLFNSYLAKFT